MDKLIKSNGEIRLTKPKHNKLDTISGRAAYVWRHVMFCISSNPKHHCMPVMSDFDLSDEDWKNRNEVVKELDAFVDRIVNSVPKTEWRGIQRWHSAIYGG
jgi:hypothetical protein